MVPVFGSEKFDEERAFQYFRISRVYQKDTVPVPEKRFGNFRFRFRFLEKRVPAVPVRSLGHPAITRKRAEYGFRGVRFQTPNSVSFFGAH